jgi:hypothetical protein
MLPINQLNDKIYAMLWFWFAGLAVFTTLALLYRCAWFFFPAIRVLRISVGVNVY